MVITFVKKNGTLVNVIYNGNEIKCSSAEGNIFLHFLIHKGAVFSKQELCSIGWPDSVVSVSSVPVAINNIRSICLLNFGDRLVATAKRAGYYISEDVTVQFEVVNGDECSSSIDDNLDSERLDLKVKSRTVTVSVSVFVFCLLLFSIFSFYYKYIQREHYRLFSFNDTFIIVGKALIERDDVTSKLGSKILDLSTNDEVEEYFIYFEKANGRMPKIVLIDYAYTDELLVTCLSYHYEQKNTRIPIIYNWHERILYEIDNCY